MTAAQPLICTFESRRSSEMRSLIERMGGDAFVAPSMQEVPVEQNVAAISAIRKVIDGTVSSLVLLTGVGTDAMVRVADSAGLKDALLDSLAGMPLLIRGPKPAAALKRLGLTYSVKAPEPNTWRELMTAIQNSAIELSGKTVAVQEYGIANEDFYSALVAAGAKVLPIPVYRWALPDNLEPLKTSIRRTIDGDFDALLFTSAQQVRHVLQVADGSGTRDDWLNAAAGCIVASIGPTCTEALQAEGLTPQLEASPPKMGPLVRAVIEFLAAADSTNR